jgi:hypothetical protein
LRLAAQIVPATAAVTGSRQQRDKIAKCHGLSAPMIEAYKIDAAVDASPAVQNG